MAFYDIAWYVNFGNGTSTGYYAVTVRPQNTAVAAGVLRRQFTAPAVGSERVFVCIVAGTTANVTDATWVLTRGAKTADGTATWQEVTGMAAVNGDATNTVNWTAAKAAGVPTLGAIIKRNSGASYQICTTAGTMAASEPSFSDTAGVTTTDGTSVWTCIGVVGNFTGGQAPFARLASVFGSNWFAPGNTIYVGNNHAESQTTAMTIASSFALTQSTVSKVICHTASGPYPPTTVATGATISTTGAVAITISPNTGAMYFYGIAFAAGVGQASGNILISPNYTYMYFDNCIFKSASTAAAGKIQVLPNVNNLLIWNNCTVSFGAVGQYLELGVGNFTWQNTGTILAGGSSVPTGLIGASLSGMGNNAVFEALDLSQLTGNLFGGPAVSTINVILVKDCKLNAAMTVTVPFETAVQLVRSDSAAAAYKSARYIYEGTETTETTITRVGGATDPAGQTQSRKIVTTANAQWLRPFKAEPYAVWNATTGSITATIYGNAATLPLTDEIWAEFEFLGSGSSTLGSVVTTTKSNVLATGASVASDASTWGGGTTPFKLTATLTPGQAGYIHARVRAAKASATYYIDPQVYLS